MNTIIWIVFETGLLILSVIWGWGCYARWQREKAKYKTAMIDCEEWHRRLGIAQEALGKRDRRSPKALREELERTQKLLQEARENLLAIQNIISPRFDVHT